MTKVAPGRSAYGAVLTESGTVCDDAILANNGDDEWLLCHGSGESMERLQESAAGKNLSIELDDNLHNISLQGPKALPLLDRFCSLELGQLAYFQHQACSLFGKACRISRTGYSGERGYEVFAAADVVCDLWDNILTEGASEGVMACSFTALDKVRIEAALLFFGYDMTDSDSPWEVGLGFTVNRRKGDFRGKAAALQLEGKERFLAAGIVADHSDGLAGGEKLLLEGEEVGVVNSPAWSHRLQKSLALVHLQPKASAAGTRLEVTGEDISCGATVAQIPFFDPEKSRTHA